MFLEEQVEIQRHRGTNLYIFAAAWRDFISLSLFFYVGIKIESKKCFYSLGVVRCETV